MIEVDISKLKRGDRIQTAAGIAEVTDASEDGESVKVLYVAGSDTAKMNTRAVCSAEDILRVLPAE